MSEGEEKVIKGIEDLRTEVRELREMVNMLVEIIVNMEQMDEGSIEVDPSMMGFDTDFKSGKYCM